MPILLTYKKITNGKTNLSANLQRRHSCILHPDSKHYSELIFTSVTGVYILHSKVSINRIDCISALKYPGLASRAVARRLPLSISSQGEGEITPCRASSARRISSIHFEHATMTLCGLDQSQRDSVQSLPLRRDGPHKLRFARSRLRNVGIINN